MAAPRATWAQATPIRHGGVITWRATRSTTCSGSGPMPTEAAARTRHAVIGAAVGRPDLIRAAITPWRRSRRRTPPPAVGRRARACSTGRPLGAGIPVWENRKRAGCSPLKGGAMGRKQRISYLPLEAMDDEMRAEMERCMREGTPRPESSAVRAHVPACFWAFARSWEAIFRGGVCDHAIKELCRVYVSRSVKCEYCGNQRSEKARAQ